MVRGVCRWPKPQPSSSSEVEGQLVQVNIRGDVADLAAIDGDLVREHAGRGDLDRVGPVVVVVAQCVGEVEDGVLADSRGVLSHVEVRRLHCTLGHRVRHQEEVELAVDDLRLLYEAVVDVGALGRVVDLAVGLLEESLSYSLVHNDQGDLWKGHTLAARVVLVG